MRATAASAPERTWKLRRERSAVDEARRFAELAVSDCDAEGRYATAMAVSEFAENLIKYSPPTAGAGAGTIAISVDAKAIRVRVTNAVTSADDARRVQETIARVASSPDVMALYRSRLHELFQNPRLPRAQLGLLRVAFEGGFRLSCSFNPPFLEIIAERPHDRDR